MELPGDCQIVTTAAVPTVMGIHHPLTFHMSVYASMLRKMHYLRQDERDLARMQCCTAIR